MIRLMAAASLLLLAGCAESEPEPAAETPEASETSESPTEESSADKSPSQKASPKSPAKPGTRITVRASQHGPMLFDSRGRAIYLWEPETTQRPECYEACAASWPPVLTRGEPVAAGAARAALLGTTRRTTGLTQVTYDGHPLYFFANDAPGQVNGHGIDAFGGVWLVVTPSGQPAQN